MAVCWVLQGARAKLSQDLVALWADDYSPALALLRRVFPPGLLRFLQQKRSPSVLSRPTSPTPQTVRPGKRAHSCCHEAATEAWRRSMDTLCAGYCISIMPGRVCSSEHEVRGT